MKIELKNTIKKRLIIIILVFIFAISFPFIQFNLLISEERKFQVVDENGNPISPCEVNHILTQFALSYEKIESLSCDDKGFVYLPKRTVRTSWAELIKGAHDNFSRYGIHASYMSDDMVAITAPGYEAKVIWGYLKKDNKIVLKKKQPR